MDAARTTTTKSDHESSRAKVAEAAPAPEAALTDPFAALLTPQYFSGMQRAVGNQAVQRIVEGRNAGFVQRLGAPSLMIGSRNSEQVTELQKNLNQIKVTGADGKPVVLVEDGKFGPKTWSAVRSFQSSRGLVADGIVGKKTGAAIDQALKNPITQVTTPWEETVGGVKYAMTSRYDWQVTDTQIHITVRLKFTGDDAPKTVARWCEAIRTTWNKFKAVDKAAKKSKEIYFDVQSVGSSEHNVVEVKKGTGRSNAGLWYTVDSGGTAMNNQVAAHEFGHMVGLADEYQLSHGDYKAVTGEDAPKGKAKGKSDAEAADVAKELHDAMREGDDKKVASTHGVVAKHDLKQGEYARTIGAEYKKAYGTELVADLVAHIPAASQWSIVEPFTVSGGGVMGDFYSHGKNAAGHDHPIAPRHMKTFVGYIQAAEGGNWTAEAK